MDFCKNCRRDTDFRFLRKYGGYCLDCSNAGAPEKDDEILALRMALRSILATEAHKMNPNSGSGRIDQVAESLVRNLANTLLYNQEIEEVHADYIRDIFSV